MIRYKQFVPDGGNIEEVEKAVTDYLHSVLAEDDDPTNDDSPVNVYHVPGDNGWCRGIWIHGEADGEIAEYPEVDKSDYEIEGATKAAGQ